MIELKKNSIVQKDNLCAKNRNGFYLSRKLLQYFISSEFRLFCFENKVPIIGQKYQFLMYCYIKNMDSIPSDP